MKKLMLSFVVFALSIGASFFTYADKAFITSEVRKILTTTDNTYGGCMAELDKTIADLGLNCPNNGWVSFSCSGDFVTKEEAMRMFDAAQLSLALNKKVTLMIVDTKKHNGFCTVVRLDVNR